MDSVGIRGVADEAVLNKELEKSEKSTRIQTLLPRQKVFAVLYRIIHFFFSIDINCIPWTPSSRG
jgi:hypothetical protein